MFSSRCSWDTRPNRLSQLLAEKRRSGAEILDLTESNPTRAGLAFPPDIVEAFADNRMLVYDPSPRGSMEARQVVADYYAARGYTVDPERILLTASTSEAYAYLFKLLADPGDHILVPRPSYPLFEFLANMESVEVRQYRLSYHGEWAIDLEALEISKRTRAIVLVNPNNPTGSYLKRRELEALRAAGIPIISDEVFSDYAFGADPERVDSLVAESACPAFAMSGLSKVAGLPQMKLGWIVANSTEAMERLEWIADTYLSVSTPVQCASRRLMQTGALVQRQIRDRTAANLAFARQAFSGTASSILHVEGGWYMTLQMPRIRSEEEWALELLSRHDVLVQPGYFYDFESEVFLIVSLLTEPRIFTAGIERLAAIVANELLLIDQEREHNGRQHERQSGRRGTRTEG
jgi:aspartate/methionine/tyrosine aminotransferase